MTPAYAGGMLKGEREGEWILRRNCGMARASVQRKLVGGMGEWGASGSHACHTSQSEVVATLWMTARTDKDNYNSNSKDIPCNGSFLAAWVRRTTAIRAKTTTGVLRLRRCAASLRMTARNKQRQRQEQRRETNKGNGKSKGEKQTTARAKAKSEAGFSAPE